MNITSTTTTTADDDHGPPPPQFAPFPESAFTFGGSAAAAAGVGGVGYAAATATLRRVKPLPRSKRRRVSDEEAGLLTTAEVVALQQQHLLQGVTAGHASANANTDTAAFPFGATTAAAAWTGSMPGGYPAGFAFELGGGVYQQQRGGAAEDYHHGANHEDDGAGQDGTGRDRGDQQGNTKKRKVPAAAHHHRGGSPSEDGDANGVIGADDQLDHRRGEHDATGMGDGVAAASSAGTNGRGAGDAGVMIGSGKPRLSISTATGIKLKEIAKIRKRLLSSVLGPASSSSPSSTTSTPTTTTTTGDLALDIALSAPLKWPPQVSLPTTTEPLASPKRRQRKRVLERRRKQRPAVTSESRCVLPTGEFTLDIPSQSSERMKTTMAEITSYRAKFAQELARISAKQAEAAKKAAAAAANAKNGGLGSGTMMTKKLSDGSKAGSSPGGGPGSKITTDGGSTTSKKKKKRSNKANDPHQIRNYIPSRLPAGAGVPQPPTPAQAAQNLKSLISPHAVQFLSAEPKPRSKKSSKGSDGNKENARPTVTSSLPPVQPADEWICSFCEFNLFYGDDSALRRAVRARKSLLTRRRRARERAAAAASGQGKLLASARKGEESDGEEELPEEEQEAKFADPAEVDARVAASMGDVMSRKPVVRDKGGGGLPPGSVGGGSTTASGTAKA